VSERAFVADSDEDDTQTSTDRLAELLPAACCSLFVRALSLFFVVTLDVVTCNLTARQCFQSAYYNKSEANSEPVFVAIRIDSLSLSLSLARSFACSFESCVRMFVCSCVHFSRFCSLACSLRLLHSTLEPALVRARYDFIIGSSHAVDNCVAVCVCVVVVVVHFVALFARVGRCQFVLWLPCLHTRAHAAENGCVCWFC